MNARPCGACRHHGQPIANMSENRIAYCARWCVWRALGEVVADCQTFEEA